MTVAEILASLESGTIDANEAATLLDEAKAAPKGPSMSVTEKGCVGFRNLPGGRPGYTAALFAGEARWIIANGPAVIEFLDSHRGKPDKNDRERLS